MPTLHAASPPPALAALAAPDARLLFLVNLITVAAVVAFASGVIAVLLRRLYHRRVEEQKLAAMGTATARILHQIKNPLQTILLHTDLLQDERITPTPQARSEVCEAIAGEAQRLAAMLTELSTYASGARRRLAPEPLAVHSMLRQVAEGVARSGRVRVETAGIGEAVVLADPYYLRQVVDNLVANACEAMEDEPERRLRLSLEERDGLAALSVQDTGPGIPPERLETLFQPFVSSKSKGMGLGLSICREIVEGHRGRIEVRSAPGRGAEFTVLLPLYAADRGAPETQHSTEYAGGVR